MDEAQTRFAGRTISDLKDGCNVTIAAFGDSITAGYHVRRTFPSFWKEMLQQKYSDAGIEIINSGNCGDTTIDGLARLDWAVLSCHPDLVSINFGINDCVQGLRLEKFEMNLLEMAARIQEDSGSEILLLSSQPLETPPYDKLVLDYYRVAKRAAERLNVGFVDIYGAWMKRATDGTPLETLILPGLDHPNEAGYRIIAEELMKFF